MPGETPAWVILRQRDSNAEVEKKSYNMLFVEVPEIIVQGSRKNMTSTKTV